MDPRDQVKLVSALEFALQAHGPQTRKGKDVPYVSHLLQVAGFVLEYGGDVELAVAGLLHDVIEDCPGVSLADLEASFGQRVAGIVQGCTDLMEDDHPDQKSDWRVRKERYLEHMRAADVDTRLVALCDKLHNISNVLADVRSHGAATFDKFNAGAREQVWYYDGVRRAAGEGLPAPLLAEYDLHVAKLKEYVAVSR